MQCISCNNEVPSKFTYAITKNCCPFCGELIMAEELQIILNSLQETMASASEQDYQKQALNWMEANFNLVSRESEEFTRLQGLQSEIDRLNYELQNTSLKPTPKSGRPIQSNTEIQMGVDNEGNQVQLQGKSIQDPNTTQTFMERSGINKTINNNDHFRKMVNQIKGKQAMEMGEGGGGMVITNESLASASAEEIEEMEQMISGGVPNISSGLDANYDDEDALPAIAEQFIANASGSNQGSQYNARDVAKLQQLQNKSARASKALSSGGGVGLIRR